MWSAIIDIMIMSPVSLWRCPIHRTATSVSEQVNRKCLLGTGLYKFQHLHRPYPIKLLTSWLTDAAAIWRINYNRIASRRTAEISTSGIAIVNMLHGYCRERRYTIGSFSASAGLFVILLHGEGRRIHVDYYTQAELSLTNVSPGWKMAPSNIGF